MFKDLPIPTPEHITFLFMKKIFVLLIFFCPLLANAQSSNDSLKVLFIGNSYTFYNDMPSMVASIAESLGRKFSYHTQVVGGARLSQHWKNPKVHEAIKSGGWDFIVLQEQSQAPSEPTEKVVRETYRPAFSLDSLAKVYNERVQVVYYLTWGRPYGDKERSERYPIVATYGGMQQRLNTSYLEMAYRAGSWCAPVGIAWQRVMEEMPEYQLYHMDNHHPSHLGSYLAANVFYTVFYREPYTSAFIADIPVDQAEYLQSVAQDAVFDNLKLLNITDTQILLK